IIFFFFFFQAEDGIRDFHVTGVQTCALPICDRRAAAATGPRAAVRDRGGVELDAHGLGAHRRLAERRRTARGRPARPARGDERRSEERRVGKEGRSRWWPEHENREGATRSGQ